MTWSIARQDWGASLPLDHSGCDQHALCLSIAPSLDYSEPVRGPGSKFRASGHGKKKKVPLAKIKGAHVPHPLRMRNFRVQIPVFFCNLFWPQPPRKEPPLYNCSGDLVRTKQGAAAKKLLGVCFRAIVLSKVICRCSKRGDAGPPHAERVLPTKSCGVQCVASCCC